MNNPFKNEKLNKIVNEIQKEKNIQLNFYYLDCYGLYCDVLKNDKKLNLSPINVYDEGAAYEFIGDNENNETIDTSEHIDYLIETFLNDHLYQHLDIYNL